ncbi:MAG: T9SS type A sorting domain-containing protein [Saprospiraceae bacterium]
MRDSNQNVWYIIPILTLIFSININAQTLLEPTLGANDTYTFTITDVESEDLIYFRFSDGNHMTTMVPDDGTSVSVERQFYNIGDYEVKAYVAKKGGTLGITSNTQGISTYTDCTSCLPPLIGMGSEQNLLLSTSWNSFFLEGIGGEIESFEDEITAMTTPTDESWFFLNTTLQKTSALLDGSVLRIYFPHIEYDIQGVIINNKWIEFTNYESETSYFPENFDLVSEVVHNPDGRVDFSLEREIQFQENIYLIVKGEPASFEDELFFSAELVKQRKKNQLTVIEQNYLAIKPTQQPHDPNNIASETPDNSCLEDINTYHVNFQNLGEGYASIVDVEVFIDDVFLNTLSLDNIETSHPDFLESSVQITPNSLKFRFNNINLPGVTQNIPTTYPYNSTMGWIKFDLALHDCLPQIPLTMDWINTTGTIYFYGSGTFIQETPMNILQHKPPCQFPCTLGRVDNGSDLISIPNNGVSFLDEDIPFEISGYPTIVNDEYFIKTSNLEKGSSLHLDVVDLSGKVWQTKNIQIENLNSEESIDISKLPSGVYFVKIEYNQSVNILKLIKI